MPLTKLQLKLEKKAEIIYLEAKKKKKRVLRNIIPGFKGRKNVRLIFSAPSDIMKDKCYVFSSYKQRNKVWLVYLKRKLHKDSYGLMHCDSEIPGNARKNIFRYK